MLRQAGNFRYIGGPNQKEGTWRRRFVVEVGRLNAQTPNFPLRVGVAPSGTITVAISGFAPSRDAVFPPSLNTTTLVLRAPASANDLPFANAYGAALALPVTAAETFEGALDVSKTLTLNATAGEAFDATTSGASYSGSLTLSATASQASSGGIDYGVAFFFSSSAAFADDAQLGAASTLTVAGLAAIVEAAELAGVASQTIAAHPDLAELSQLAVSGALAVAANAAEAFSNKLDGVAAETLAAHAVESFGAQIDVKASLLLGAIAGEAFAGNVADTASLTLAAHAVESFVSQNAAVAQETLAANAGETFAAGLAAVVSQALTANAAESFASLNDAIAAQSIAAHAAEAFAAARATSGSTLLSASASDTFAGALDDYASMSIAASPQFVETGSVSVLGGFALPTVAALTESGSLAIDKALAVTSLAGDDYAVQLAASAQNLLAALAGEGSRSALTGDSEELDTVAGLSEISGLDAGAAMVLGALADVGSDAEVTHKFQVIQGGGGGGGWIPRKKTWQELFRYQDYDLADVAYAREADVSVPPTKLSQAMPLLAMAIARAEETLAFGRAAQGPELARSLRLGATSLNEKLPDGDAIGQRRTKFFHELREWARHVRLTEKLFAASPYLEDSAGWHKIFETLDEQRLEWTRQVRALEAPVVFDFRARAASTPAASTATHLLIAAVGLGGALLLSKKLRGIAPPKKAVEKVVKAVATRARKR